MRVNGKEIEIIKEIPLKEFLETSGYDIGRIAVELNGEIVPKKTYGEMILKNTDSIEIVSFVGGG
ncbi:MAG: sulfur carrier protein ThiS [Candidatus Methanomethylophilaceae archaeon]|jgi:sulfur carrier protein